MNLLKYRIITLNWTVDGNLCAFTYLTKNGSNKWKAYQIKAGISKKFATPAFGPFKVRKEIAFTVRHVFDNGLKPKERGLLKMAVDYASDYKTGEYPHRKSKGISYPEILDKVEGLKKMEKWNNIHHEFYNTKKKALKAMRGHLSDIDAPIGKYQGRVIKTIGRRRPWGIKYVGWQVQYRLNPKYKKGKAGGL